MMKFDIFQLSIYRWRYWIGYSVVTIGLIIALIFAGMYLPGGISTQEMQSVIKSNSLGLTSLFTATDITNLPYHLLQHAIITIFGVSILSIKLPSIILALISTIGMLFILKLWFKHGIAVLASLIAVTTGQLIFIAQDGTAGILYLFWPVMLILLASLISSQKKFRMFYKISFFITAALSLYTPLSIYIQLALATAIILHPHLRFMIRQLSKPKILISLAVSFVMLIPLTLAAIKSPSLILTLLGIPTHWPNFGANFASLGSEYFGFASPSGTLIMTPFFELGSMLIIAIGLYQLIKTRETAKSYVIGLWILCLIPVIILNPSLTSISYLPLILLLALGIKTLLSHWYELFPLNPYARIGGLIPVVILVTVLTLSGMDRYAHGYQYDPNIAPNFSTDLKLIPTETKNLVVSVNELPFYKVVADHNKSLTVTTAPLPNFDNFIATRQTNLNFSGYKIKQIITSPISTQGNRLYLYTKI
jgi:hypothetical protein